MSAGIREIIQTSDQIIHIIPSPNEIARGTMLKYFTPLVTTP